MPAAPRPEAGDGADVTAYLPDAAEEGFVSFRPGPSLTPALRSGTIDPTAPYTFSLPKNKRWKASKVANAISGNYCAGEADTRVSTVEGKVVECISSSRRRNSYR